MDGESREATGSHAPSEGRLESWKEIAAHLNRHVTTVRRWEKHEGLPVHRHLHTKLGTVYAFRDELDAWWRSRSPELEPRRAPAVQPDDAHPRPRMLSLRTALLSGLAVLVLGVGTGWMLARKPTVDGDEGRRARLRAADDAANAAMAGDNVNPAARQEYLIGRYHLWRDSQPHLQRAIAHFERAIALDPGYAAAYASLAHAWWKRGLWEDRLAETEPRARAAVQAALRLDNDLPEAHVVEADLARLYDHDLVRAEALVARAVSRQPDNVDAHYTYGLVLMTRGRFPEAIRHMETAAQLEPLLPAIQSDFGRVLYRARRYEDAIVRLNRALELEPAMDWLVQPRLALVYQQLGQYHLALSALDKSGRTGDLHEVQRAGVLALMGEPEQARRLLEPIVSRAGPELSFSLAQAYAALGETDRALDLLLQSSERNRPGPNFALVEPSLDGLRTSPRWADLVRRLAVPPTPASNN